MEKKVIIFDLDGVLFDSIELIHTYTEARFEYISRAALAEMHTGDVDFNNLVGSEWKKKEETPEELTSRLAEYREKKMRVPMYSGMKELVGDLAAHAIIALNTSASNDSSIPLLEREHIDEHFALVATRDLHPSKAEKFKLIGETFKQDPKDMLFITDTLHDIREAAKVGIPTIAVTWGVHDRTFFNREPHSHLVAIVDTPEELAKVIASQKIIDEIKM